MNDPNQMFGPRGDKKQLELGDQFAPKFDDDGLIPAVAVDHKTGEVLMFAFLNRESLAKTVELGEMVYFSRSRKKLWHKGEESGNTQKVKELLVDCDQDVLVARVEQVGGAACHNGYRSCFYRRIATENPAGAGPLKLLYTQSDRVFDPDKVYHKK